MSYTIMDRIASFDSTDHGFTFVSGEEETFLSLESLRETSDARAEQLRRAGYRRGDRLGLVLAGQREFVTTFFAALRAGVVAVPIYPPLILGADSQHYLGNVRRILEVSRARGVAVSSSLRSALAPLASTCEVFAPEDLDALPCGAELGGLPAPDDVAFLQFTSGSTAAPKGVVVAHRQLMANAVAIFEKLKLDPERDSSVSWLPMYHDMGLIGFVIVSLLAGGKVTFLPTLDFARRPLRWLELIHEKRATVSFAPSFAYGLVATRASEEDLAALDLSSWRIAGCGAEPIEPGTVRRFVERFRPTGLSPRAFLPCYGIAESTLAVTIGSWERPWSSLWIDGDSLAREGRARVVEPQSPRAREVVSCGTALAGHEVRVVDEAGRPVPERTEGEITVRGPSVATRYERDEEATRRSFRGEWLWTGDLGFLYDGELYVTGRTKDVVILAGRNFHAHDVEWCVSRIPGLRKGAAVAFAMQSEAGERLVVVAETRPGSGDVDPEREAIRRVRNEIGASLSELRCVPPGSLPRTSSGKLRRARTREMYEAGAFDLEPEEA